MAQLRCIGLCKPCINLPFGDCAMYFDHGVFENMMIVIVKILKKGKLRKYYGKSGDKVEPQHPGVY